MKQKTLLLQAIRCDDHWIIKDISNDEIIDFPSCRTRKNAYDMCALAYPYNSVWNGKRVHDGYRINI